MTTTADPATSATGPAVPWPPLVSARTRVGRRWLDAPLRLKGVTVIAAFALVLVPPLVVGAVVNATLDDARAEARHTSGEIAELGVLQDSLGEAVTTMQEYLTLALTDASLIERYRAAASRIPDELDTLVDGLPDDLADPAQALQEATRTLIDDLDALTRFGVAGPRVADVSTDPAFFVLDPALVDVILRTLDSTSATFAATDAIDRDLAVLLDEQRQDVDSLHRLSVSATVVALALALAVAITTVYAVTNGLARRVSRLADNAHRFLRDAPLLPTTASTDEIGQVAMTMFSAGELLNQRRDEAIAATRAKDEFLARVSHELKTPLTAMIGFAQLLEEDPDLAPGSHEDARRIVAAGQHLHRLIEELLDVRAIEVGKLAMEIEPVPLRPIAAEVVARVRPRADERSLTISVDVPDDLVVAADRRRLREVLLTLLSNAVTYDDESGRIELAAARRGPMVHIRVTDTGPGFSPEDLQVVFAPFERPDGSDVEGTGMGLALTKQVVEAMGGEIGVETAVGRGSTFWVGLPAPGRTAFGEGADAQAGTPPASPPGAVDHGSGAPPVRAAAATTTPGSPPARGAVAEAPPERGDRARAASLPRRSRRRAGQRWSDASLRRKLLSLVVLMALVWAPPMVIGTVLSARLVDARREAAKTTQNLEEITALQGSVLRSASAIQNYLALGLDEASFVEDYRAASAAIPDQLADLRDGLPDDVAGPATELEEATDALVDSLDFVVDYGAPALENPDPTNEVVRFPTDDALGGEVGELVAATARAYDAVADLEAELRARLSSDRSQVDDLQALMVGATLISMVAALIVGTTGAYLVMTDLVRRIAALSDNVDRLLRGEPLHLPPASADEIGQLTDATLYVGELLDQRREIAESATRAKDEFLSRVSHELETPLTAMVGDAEKLDQDPALSPQSRDDAGHIVSAGRQLHGLIEEMLDIKAIEAGRLALTIEPVPVHLSAHESISLIRPRADARAITIEADCPPDLTVAADRRRLREVLLNLLSNAVKYNRRNGRIELAASRHDTSVRISVRDTGPGISPSDQSHLFMPFERLDAADTDVEGTGIGLALTKHVVQAMHGTIGVESTVGRGSTFWFDLPAADGAARAPAASGPLAPDR